ncbi:hypothetical protein V3C99_006248 [Haemonchus contortus]
MNVGRLYIEGHALFKIIVGDDFNTKEYKMPFCLTFIDLKKAFDSFET